MSQRPIYLERIKISNFRSHGSSELRLPAEPGVVLLVGMNGLGKTSVFEAIEWALTDTVRRLEALPLTRGALQDALRRTGSRWKPRVTLDFGAGGQLTRDSSHHPSPSEVVRLLVAETWPHMITEPATYLALTHLLPQCPQIRFSQQDPKDQWDVLKVPAGVERLDAFAIRLSGQALQGEFDRAIEAISQSIVDQRAVLERWNSLEREAERLRAIATGRASLTRPEIESTTRRLEEQWRLVGSPTERESVVRDITRSFQRLGGQLAAEKQRLTVVEVRAGNAARVVQEWNELEQSLATINAAREALVLQAEEAEAAVRSAFQRQEALTAALAEAQRNDGDARGRLVDVQQLLTAINGAAETGRALVITTDALAALDHDLAALDASFVQAERSRTQAAASRDTLAAINQQILQLVALGQGHRSALSAQERAARARQELEKLAPQLARAREDDRNGAAEIYRLRSEITACEGRANQVRISVRKLSDALAAIAAHLSPSDTICPVCQHVHPPAELQRLATESASAAAPTLTALMAEAARLQEQLGVKSEAQRAFAQQIVVLEEQIRVHEASVRAAETEKGELESHPFLAGLRWEQVPAHLLSLGAELERKRTEAETNLRTAESTIPKDASALQGRIAAGRNQRERLVEERRRLQEVADRHDAAIRSRSALKSEIGGAVERLPAMISGLHDVVEQAGVQLAEQRQQQTLAVQEHQRRVAERAAALARRDQNTQQARTLETARENARTRWREAGFEGEPALATLTQRRSQWQRDAEAVSESLSTLEQLMRAEEVWHNQEQLSALERARAQQIASGGVSDASEYRQKLLTNLQSTQARLALTSRAKALAMQVAEALRDASENYSERVLKPLADRIDSFHHALSPFPEYSFDAHVHTYERQRTGFELRMHVPDPGHSDVSQNPQTRLSEGQVSALGVCVLLAASTSYRWSRWRALLLDDPFQHTDLIHSAALIDVLRKLTRLEDGYQIILSTHDLEEAEFIQRKCEAAKVKFLRCTMLGLTSTGLRWERGGEFGPQ